MATLVRLPRLGANVSEGTVGEWYARLGDAVTRGDALAAIITSKAAFDVEASEEGVVLAILAPEKSVVPVGYVLGITGSPGEVAPDISAENNRIMEEFRRAVLAGKPGNGETHRVAVRATPRARHLATSEDVDLGDVPPSSENGVICEEDVRRFLKVRLRN